MCVCVRMCMSACILVCVMRVCGSSCNLSPTALGPGRPRGGLVRSPSWHCPLDSAQPCPACPAQGSPAPDPGSCIGMSEAKLRPGLDTQWPSSDPPRCICRVLAVPFRAVTGPPMQLHTLCALQGGGHVAHGTRTERPRSLGPQGPSRVTCCGQPHGGPETALRTSPP